MRCLPVVLAVAIVGLGSSRLVTAQEPDRPTLTIARFEGSLKAPRGTEDAGADMAEILASRVQESGCCRVMLQSWLPGATADYAVSLDTVRQSAVAAQVEYVISGRVTKSRVIRRSSVPSIAGVLGQMRPAGLRYPAGVVPGLVAPRMPHLIPPPAQSISMVTLQMRILDAASGKVLRMFNVTKPVITDDIALVTNSPEVAEALVRAVAEVARERR